MANNLLVDWLNKKPKLTLKNAQTVVNNNTASNMQNITTPAINAGSVAGVQQVNKPTLQVSAPLTTTNVKSSIQSNNPAFNNGALVTAQNQPSRFIGFQQQPQVANTMLDRTPNERQGLSWKKLTTTGYNYVPSEVSKAESSNRAEENRYRTMSEAFYDLQGTLYNKGKVLGENELRQKFPEFKDLDINILNELQNELLPIVSSGKGVDADQISQKYPELLKGKELKDINTVKENVQKGNDRYKGWEKAIQKVAKGDVEGMSSEGVQSVQDAKAIWQAVQAVKKDGVIGGGTDYEILRELYQRDPEIKRLMDDFNSRELTEKDKIIWGREDANKIGQLFRGATDWLRKDDEFMKSDEELESLKNKAKAMEDDYWGQVAGTARVGLRSTADTWEKFIYRMSQDAKLWTIEDIDDYLKQSEENERNVAEYNASVNRETENLAQNTINPDVRNYYNNHSMSRSIALGDVPGFFLQSTKSAAENIDMPIIIAAGVVAPEVVLPLMATDTYVRESEDAFETLLENGAGYDDAEQGAVIVGVASTAVEIYLEKLLGGVETTASRTIRDALMKDISKKTTEMVAERGLVDLAKRGLTTQLRSSMEEGLEEIVQQSIQNYAVSKYNPDVKITDGLREAFEGGFFNPMNLLAGGGDIMSNVDVNALNQGAYNAGVRTREIVDNTKNALNQGAYNAGAFLGNMTEDFKNSVSSQGGTNNTQQQGQQTQFNTTSENQNNINGENNTENGGWSQPKKGVISKAISGIGKAYDSTVGKAIDTVAEKGAEAITSTSTPQDKLFQAVSPTLNKLTNKRGNYEQKRQNADRTNELIVEYGHTPTNSTEYYDALIKTKNALWKNEIQRGLDEHKYTTISSKELTDAVRDEMQEDARFPLETNKSDLAKLNKELASLDRQGELTLEQLEAIKQQINAKLNYGKNAEAGEIYEKGLRAMNTKISQIEDQLIAKLPGEFTKFKKDYGALKDMEEDVLKMMLKDMKKKDGGGLTQNMGRLAGVGKLLSSPLEGTMQIIFGETIGKAKETNFLIQKGFEDLRKQYKGEKKTLDVKDKPAEKVLALPDGIKLTKVTEIDARKPKNKVTKKNNKSDNNKKSDSSSSDDGGTPTGGTPAGTNPTNNQGGTTATDDTKNTVTKKKSETKKQVKNAITNQKSDLTADENVKLREGISILQEVKQEVDDSNFEGIVDIVNRLGEEKTKQVIKDMNDLRRKLENISERQAELGKDTRADRSVLHDLRGQILFLEYALNEKSNVGKTADGLDKVANHSRPSKVQRELIADEIEKYKYRDNDPLFNINVKTIRDEKLVRGALYGYMTDALAPTNRAAELGGNILRKVGIDPTEYEQEASKAPTHYTDGKANEYKTPEERATTPKQEENQTKKFTYDEYGEVMNKIGEVEKKINKKLDKQYEQERAEKMSRFEELRDKEDKTDAEGKELSKLAGELNNMSNKYDKLKEDELKKQAPELLQQKEELQQAFDRDWKAAMDKAIERKNPDVLTKEEMKQLGEIQAKMAELMKDQPDAKLTESQKKQLENKTQEEKNALIKKWQQEWLEANPIPDEIAQQLSELYDMGAAIVERAKKARAEMEDMNKPVEKSKTKATTNAKNKVTNPSKAKTTSLFNENEVDKGNKSEGLNPDALPLSDYREMQRLNDGEYYSLSRALRLESLKDYMAKKIATKLVGDYDKIVSDEFDPENLEEERVERHSEVEEMYDAYEEYLDMKNSSDPYDENTLKNTLETANDYANDLVKGKTAKELIDQYTPEYESDLKVYNRLIKKYPSVFANGKIDLTGAEGKAMREFANQENETAQDIDYQELAERENETAQIPTIFEEDLEQMNLRELDENETPQANEEEMNKVTKKQAEKPKNLVTSKSKVDQILEKAKGTEIKVKIGNDEDSYLVVFNADGKDQAYTVTEEQLKELNDKGANFENVNERAERQAKIDKEVEQNIKAFERTEEKPKDLVTNPKKSETTTSKGEIQEIDKDTYFDDIVKNLKDHPREMFIYKDGSYFYPHYILPSGKVITPENTYWGEVSSEEAARNWLLKEAEEHSEENETKKAEKLKEIVGKTAEKYEATLKRIESDNSMQEIWASGDYFKYGTSNSQMAKAKKESEANAEVGTFKKDVIDGKEGYRIFVAGTKNEAIRAFYEPKTGKTYRIYRGPVIDDSKPYTTKQVERIEKFLQNVEKQLDKETKREKPQEKTYITQEWLDGLKPDNDGVIELDSKGNESFALRKGKETLIKEGKADGKYIENYGGERSPQYLAFYIKDGVVYEGRKGLEDQYMKTKQEAVDWLNQKEKDVEHEATERYTQTDYETLPKTISIESEAEKAGPKRIAPDRVKRQQETYDQGLESVKNVLKQSPVKIYELGFKSDRSKAVQDILAERRRIRELPEAEAEKQWNELAKSVYEDLVIKDISKGYRYPEDVTSKFPKAQMKNAVDARARYEKGLFTSFSAKDTRANNQYRDEIGAGIKSQDGKHVTQEQMQEIVDGIRNYSQTFGIDMKKLAEDNNIVYVHLHGGNPFLMGGGGVNIGGLYRNAAGNISVSLGGKEGVMEKGEDGEMKKTDIKTTTAHELTHAIDGMLDNKLFSSQDIEILKKTMNKPTHLINYYNKSHEIVARAVEQYAADKIGKNYYKMDIENIDWGKGDVEFVYKDANYVNRQAYRDQENFDKYVKPIVEKNMKEKLKDYLIQQPKKNVLSNDKNKITSK